VAIKTARELALLPYAKRTVAERLGGRGGRGGGGRGGPGGPRGPREEREAQSEVPAGAEDAAVEAAVEDLDDLDIGAEDSADDDEG